MLRQTERGSRIGLLPMTPHPLRALLRGASSVAPDRKSPCRSDLSTYLSLVVGRRCPVDTSVPAIDAAQEDWSNRSMPNGSATSGPSHPAAPVPDPRYASTCDRPKSGRRCRDWVCKGPGPAACVLPRVLRLAPDPNHITIAINHLIDKSFNCSWTVDCCHTDGCRACRGGSETTNCGVYPHRHMRSTRTTQPGA